MILTTAPVVVAISTTQHANVLRAGTTFNVAVQTPVDSTTAQVGDNIVLVVNDPTYPTLQNAKITAHITSVRSATSQRPASIRFLFDNIVFANGMKEQFRGYVDNPRITRTTLSTPQPASQMGVQPNPAFAPNPNTIVWQHDLSFRKQKTTDTQPTGGHGYSKGAGIPIKVAAGTPAKIELASDLKTP
jgi:hypothetical protein